MKKQVDPFYQSPQWREKRQQILRRDNFTCVAPGCDERACIVDHITSRKHGGAPLDDANLRSLCRMHDNQIKELGDARRRAGRFVPAFDENGYPIA